MGLEHSREVCVRKEDRQGRRKIVKRRRVGRHRVSGLHFFHEVGSRDWIECSGREVKV